MTRSWMTKLKFIHSIKGILTKSVLFQVLLDGCKQLTDVSIALLTEALPEKSVISAASTNLRYLYALKDYKLESKASPLMISGLG